MAFFVNAVAVNLPLKAVEPGSWHDTCEWPPDIFECTYDLHDPSRPLREPRETTAGKRVLELFCLLPRVLGSSFATGSALLAHWRVRFF